MDKYKCIVTITCKGKGGLAVEAAKRSGARGGTILTGSGSGLKETRKFLGMRFAGEKEVVLTVVKEDRVPKIVEAIHQAVELDHTGEGILFILDIYDVEGLSEG
jgi:nitrogen regulatory protein PII